MSQLPSDEFIRYSRQIMLENWNESGQIRLSSANVVVIGCGGLGNIAASLLAGAGVGQLTLIDEDVVELSNLPRQLAFDTADIENAKVFALANRLREQNDKLSVSPVAERFSTDNAQKLLSGADLVLDCSDNFTTRFCINHACISAQISLISASVIGWQGQLMLVAPGEHDAGCYQCLFQPTNDESPSCKTAGVSGAAVAIVGGYQANEAIRHLLGHVSELARSVMLIDTLTLNNQLLERTKDQSCIICSHHRSISHA